MRDCRRVSSTISPAAGRDVGEALVRASAHRGHHLHRLGPRGSAADCSRWPAAPIRDRASPRWAARIPASSPRHADLDRAAAGIVRSAYRHGRPEVLGVVAAVRARERRRRADRTHAGADRRDPHRRSASTRELARAGRQRNGVRRTTAQYAEALRTGGARLLSGGARLGEGEPTRPTATTSNRCWPKRRCRIRCGSRRCSCRS